MLPETRQCFFFVLSIPDIPRDYYRSLQGCPVTIWCWIEPRPPLGRVLLKNQRDGTAGKVFALDDNDPNLIPSIPYDPLSNTRSDTEHRPRSKPWAPLGVNHKTETNKKYVFRSESELSLNPQKHHFWRSFHNMYNEYNEEQQSNPHQISMYFTTDLNISKFKVMKSRLKYSSRF